MKYMGLLMCTGILFAIGLVAFETYEDNQVRKHEVLLRADTCLTYSVS